MVSERIEIEGVLMVALFGTEDRLLKTLESTYPQVEVHARLVGARDVGAAVGPAVDERGGRLVVRPAAPAAALDAVDMRGGNGTADGDAGLPRFPCNMCEAETASAASAS